MVLWVSAVQALSAYCRRHDTLEPSGTDPRDERDLGLLKRPAHSRCRGIVDRCMNQANMVTREGSGLQADRHPTRLAMTVISWGAIVLTGLMQSPTQKCMSKPRVGLTWTLLLLILSGPDRCVASHGGRSSPLRHLTRDPLAQSRLVRTQWHQSHRSAADIQPKTQSWLPPDHAAATLSARPPGVFPSSSQEPVIGGQRPGQGGRGGSAKRKSERRVTSNYLRRMAQARHRHLGPRPRALGGLHGRDEDEDDEERRLQRRSAERHLPGVYRDWRYADLEKLKEALEGLLRTPRGQSVLKGSLSFTSLLAAVQHTSTGCSGTQRLHHEGC